MMKIATALLCVTITVQAFAPTRRSFLPRTGTIQDAGGFEWEDPVVALEQHVDNPFKNSELLNSSDGMKIDPARLLSPRLAGSNIYLIGMMGCGKSSVGDIVARRTFQCCVSFIFETSCSRNSVTSSDPFDVSCSQVWDLTTFWILILLLREQQG